MTSSAATEGFDALNMIVAPAKSFQKLLPINIPNSVEGYRQRVESYTTFRWLTHLPFVSPLECARRGWECVETDLLRCVSCRVFVYGRNDDLLTNTDSDTKLKDALVQSHKSYCIWSTTSSPSSFHTLRFSSNGECRNQVFAALRAFAQLPRCAIPTLDLSSLSSSFSSPSATSSFDVDELSLLPSLESERERLRVSVDAWRPLLTLVLCGWTLATEETAHARMWKRLCIKIGCRFCRRSLGLWDYKRMFPGVESVEVDVAHEGKMTAVADAAVGEESFRPKNGIDSREDEADNIVAIVSRDSFSNPVDDDSSFKILRPESSPPKTPISKQTEENSVEEKPVDDENQTTPKSNRKSWKKSPDKAAADQPLSQSPHSVAAKLSTSPSTEIRTRSQSQSSPSNAGVGSGAIDGIPEQDGITTRSGTIMRSPSGEPPLGVSEKKKRQRSGDSNHSSDGERSSKRAATAASDGEIRRKISGGSTSSSKGVAVVEAKAGGREVEEEHMGSESEDESANSPAAFVACGEAELVGLETVEPMEFGTATLDAVAEHRVWCPYALAEYAFGEDVNLPAWEYVKRCLEASYEEEGTPKKSSWMNDNLHKARKLMGF